MLGPPVRPVASLSTSIGRPPDRPTHLTLVPPVPPIPGHSRAGGLVQAWLPCWRGNRHLDGVCDGGRARCLTLTLRPSLRACCCKNAHPLVGPRPSLPIYLYLTSNPVLLLLLRGLHLLVVGRRGRAMEPPSLFGHHRQRQHQDDDHHGLILAEGILVALRLCRGESSSQSINQAITIAIAPPLSTNCSLGRLTRTDRYLGL